MDIRYHIDPDTGDPHIYRHGVGEDETEDVLRSPLEIRTERGGARVAVGQTSGGRYLRVIHRRDRESRAILVITAYDLTGRPLAAFRRRMRRRSR